MKGLSRVGFGLYSLCGLMTALFISWAIWAKLDFAYSYLHSAIEIGAHVQTFGPQNRFKREFHRTDRTEHIRLFSKINASVHQQGKGLETIAYYTPQGQKIDILLRKAEVIHLRDVATLIDTFRIMSICAMIIWLTTTLFYVHQRRPLPGIKVQVLSVVALSFFCSVLVLVIGPITVFYAFHEWLFPTDNQWFFYYQESLMTILMKAPYLFGWIAAFIALLAIPLYLASIYGISRWASARSASK